ncbi:MAG: serine/threonine protein kinase [Deltaproteobacteria bacterium]|nr:serine/threonine protein kinase [Deltaproteobacteria bacterium]
MTKICPECLEHRPAQLSRCPEDSTELLEVQTGDDPRLGTVVVGRYLILSLLGEGGMGRVYRAWQLSTARVVALKVLIAEGKLPKEIVQRFQREARVTASLRSPHTITIHDFGQLDDGALYIIMELLHGKPLDEVLRTRGRLEPTRVRRIVDQVCLSLREAHDRGLVHRDLKPGNIILDTAPDGTDYAKVLDFGIVKVVDEGAHKLTQTGATIGTIAYMAPEQIDGRGVGRHADIYALGVSMFEMLTGRLPFEEASAVAMMFKHASAPPPHLQDLIPSDELERIDPVVQRCLAKSPSDRYASVDELREALAALGPLASSGAERGSTQAWGAREAPSGTADFGAPSAGGSAMSATRDAALAATGMAPSLAATGVAPPSSALAATGLAQAPGVVDEPDRRFAETLEAPRKRRPAPWLYAVAALVLLVVAVGLWQLTASRSEPDAAAPQAPAPSAPSKTAPEPTATAQAAAPPAARQPETAPRASAQEPVAVVLPAVAADPAPTAPAELAHAAPAAEALAAEEPAPRAAPVAEAKEPAPPATPAPVAQAVDPAATAEPTPHPAAEPPRKVSGARVSGVHATGGLSDEQARKVLAKAAASLRRCYASAAGESGDPIAVSLMVTSAGGVRTVNAKGSAAASAFEACAKSKLEALSFPSLSAGTSFAAVRFTVKP